ncbi:MAG: hypothetical protein ACYCVB_10755 [Bacilli bacterium]
MSKLSKLVPASIAVGLLVSSPALAVSPTYLDDSQVTTSSYQNFVFRTSQSTDIYQNDHIDWSPTGSSGDGFLWYYLLAQEPSAMMYVYLYNNNFVNTQAAYDIGAQYVGTINQYTAPAGWSSLPGTATGLANDISCGVFPGAYDGACGADEIEVNWLQQV